MLTRADDAEPKYRAPALEKGLDILEILAREERPLTVSQLSNALGRSVSELFRMVQVLEFRGFIEGSPQGFRLTNRLFTLGLQQAPLKSVVETALPIMRDLAAATYQSCHLVVMSGDQIVVVARVESPGDLGYSVRVGYRRNLIDTTSGLVFYGCSSVERRAALRALLTDSFGARRVASFVRKAEPIGQEGFAARPSDFVEGVTDLAAPIRHNDLVEAALVTPYIRQTRQTTTRDETVAKLRQAAFAISDTLTNA
ncbi:MAG: IclR family transcriptional regulator [Brevundimonas sp.]